MSEESPGQRLRAWRGFLGLTQAALEARSGVSQQMISELEKGGRNPGDDTKAALRACGFDWDDPPV